MLTSMKVGCYEYYVVGISWSNKVLVVLLFFRTWNAEP